MNTRIRGLVTSTSMNCRRRYVDEDLFQEVGLKWIEMVSASHFYSYDTLDLAGFSQYLTLFSADDGSRLSRSRRTVGDGISRKEGGDAARETGDGSHSGQEAEELAGYER